MRVVVTGAAGLIGGIVSAALADRHELVGADRARRTGVHRVDVARSPRALERLVAGADAVVDLAGLPQADQPWDGVWRNNVRATINTLEAAWRADVRRYVFASSNHVTGLYERDDPYARIVAGRYEGLDPAATPFIRPDWPIRPDGPYAVGKAFGEAAARYAADAHGLSAICLRIGTVNADDRPHDVRGFATLLTHADLVRLVAAALDAPSAVGFAVCYGVSRNTWRIWDLDAGEAIGYRPEDDAETLR
jgi:nucleoside-diphosphate-sugar epimerase